MRLTERERLVFPGHHADIRRLAFYSRDKPARQVVRRCPVFACGLARGPFLCSAHPICDHTCIRLIIHWLQYRVRGTSFTTRMDSFEDAVRAARHIDPPSGGTLRHDNLSAPWRKGHMLGSCFRTGPAEEFMLSAQRFQ